MFGAIGRFVLYRLVGGRVLLVLSAIAWIWGRLRGGARRDGARFVADEPSQGETRLR